MTASLVMDCWTINTATSLLTNEVSVPVSNRFAAAVTDSNADDWIDAVDAVDAVDAIDACDAKDVPTRW